MGIGQPGHEDPQDIEAREEHLLLRVRQLADDRHEAERVLIEVVKQRDEARAAVRMLTHVLRYCHPAEHPTMHAAYVDGSKLIAQWNTEGPV